MKASYIVPSVHFFSVLEGCSETTCNKEFYKKAGFSSGQEPSVAGNAILEFTEKTNLLSTGVVGNSEHRIPALGLLSRMIEKIEALDENDDLRLLIASTITKNLLWSYLVVHTTMPITRQKEVCVFGSLESCTQSILLLATTVISRLKKKYHRGFKEALEHYYLKIREIHSINLSFQPVGFEARVVDMLKEKVSHVPISIRYEDGEWNLSSAVVSSEGPTLHSCFHDALSRLCDK